MVVGNLSLFVLRVFASCCCNCSVTSIIVGTKADCDEEKRAVSHAEADAYAQHVRAAASLECSPRQLQGVDQVFVTAAQASLLHRPPNNRSGCSVQ
jgi:hypothetical protein